MSTSVRVYQSTDTGAPSVSGTAGALITLLDACLINGYGTVTLDSLVISGNVATCTKSAGHGFTAIGATGPVIRVAGATPTALNGDWRVTISSSTAFTFTTTVSNQTATGTITALRAPLGFSKTHSGTNKAAYRADSIQATRLYLRVDDTNTINATVNGFETMSGVDTGTGQFPAAAQYICKSISASATARPWKLIGDERLFYLIINSDGTTSFDAMAFGDINSYKSGDAYHCWLMAETSSSGYSNSLLSNLASVSGSTLARSYSQTGGAIASARYSHGIATSLGGAAAGIAYPNPVDNSLLAWPVEVWEGITIPRGLAPGLWNPIHAATNLYIGTIVDAVSQLDGHTLLVVGIKTATIGRAAFDVTGPWR